MGDSGTSLETSTNVKTRKRAHSMNSHKPWQLLQQITFAVTLISVLSCSDHFAARCSANETQDYDRGILVVLAPGGPVFAELRISVAHRPYRQWVAEFLAGQLDVNGSGALSTSELKLLTERVRKLIRVDSPKTMLQQASGSTEASSVPVTVFAKWMQQRIPRAFDISAESSDPDNSVRLGNLLDVNGDSLVSGDELDVALTTMRFRDLDDDQTFSVSELLPYRDPRTQTASLTPDVASLPFVHLADSDSVERAATRIAKQYGAKPGTDVSLFRFSATQLANADLAATTVLDHDALLALLRSPPFHFVIEIKLSDLANRSQTDVIVAPAARSFCMVGDDAFHDITLNIDGIPLTVKSRGGSMNDRSYVKGFLGQNFLMYDGDASQSLDETEFASFARILTQAGVDGDFEALDVNGDYMVTRDEMNSFTERDLFASRSRIDVSIHQDGKTLFGIMDVNGDRRLTTRELQEGTTALTKYDLNGDAQFGESELGTEYVLTIGLGRSEVRRMTRSRMMGMQDRNLTDAILPGTAGLTGPEWFRRMDRNQDGDVSKREFLGPLTTFLQLDQNTDGLIDADEAERAE
jgi:EF hand